MVKALRSCLEATKGKIKAGHLILRKSPKRTATGSSSRVRLFVHEAKRKVRIFSVSCRSAMNLVRGSLFAVAMRNSGSVWRSAFAATNWEGGNAGTNGLQPGPERIPNEAGEQRRQDIGAVPGLK